MAALVARWKRERRNSRQQPPHNRERSNGEDCERQPPWCVKILAEGEVSEEIAAETSCEKEPKPRALPWRLCGALVSKPYRESDKQPGDQHRSKCRERENDCEIGTHSEVSLWSGCLRIITARASVEAR